MTERGSSLERLNAAPNGCIVFWLETLCCFLRSFSWVRSWACFARLHSRCRTPPPMKMNFLLPAFPAVLAMAAVGVFPGLSSNKVFAGPIEDALDGKKGQVVNGT